MRKSVSSSREATKLEGVREGLDRVHDECVCILRSEYGEAVAENF